MYRIAEMTSAERIPIGTSRWGFRVSRAVVEAVSNPIYEKKMIAAPCSSPTGFQAEVEAAAPPTASLP
jgi:hypothetical protein